MVKYSYDAWGKCKVLGANGAEITDMTHIGNVNPFRYRGYYLDTNTGFYYLQSRFYDPETGRFLSADTVDYLEPDTVNGLNLYAYCRNNPVMYSDPSGHSLISAIIIGAIVGAVVGGVYGGITAHMSGQSVLGGVLSGIVGGLIMGAGAGLATLFMAPLLSVTASAFGLNAFVAHGLGILIAFGTGAVGGALAESINQGFNTGHVDLKSVGKAALQWGTINVASAFLASFGEGLTIMETGFFTESALQIASASIKTSFATGFFGMLADWYRSVME